MGHLLSSDVDHLFGQDAGDNRGCIFFDHDLDDRMGETSDE